MREKAARVAHFNSLSRAVVAFFAIHVFMVFILPTLVGREDSVISHSLPMLVIAILVESGLLISLIFNNKKHGAIASMMYGSMLFYVALNNLEVVITPLYLGFSLMQTAIASVLWKSHQLDTQVLQGE